MMTKVGRCATVLGAAVAAIAITGVLSGAVRVSGGAPLAPDRFWQAVVPGHPYEQHSSILDMAASADAVVRGHIASIAKGRNLVADAETGEIAAYATLTVAIDELIAGVIHTEERATVKVEIFLDDPEAYGRIAESVPQESAIWFLRNKAVEAALLGLPADYPGAGEDYYRVVSNEGILREVEGDVVPVQPSESDWLAALDGRAIDDVLSELRER